MIVLNEFISERLIYALGWTLVHSLWQSSLIALAYFLFTHFSRKSSSPYRYNLGIFSLILLLGTTGITFWRAFKSFIPDQGILEMGPITGKMVQPVVASAPVISGIQNFISQHMPIIVGLWFLGVLVLVIHFISDCLGNLKIKNYPSRELPDIWHKRLSHLCQRMNLNKLVQIKESIRTYTPMTIGHLKPVIFFPVGLLTGIPFDQVEAIIAHELAHILRRDYLVNIIQNFIDIFYFYHPGVRWLSARIRLERENCCDDIAVGLIGDSLKFAKALANIQVWNLKQPVLAMHITGKRDKLFHRIRRVTKMKKKGTRSSEGLLGACVLGLFLVIAGIGANAASLAPDHNGEYTMFPAGISMSSDGTAVAPRASRMKMKTFSMEEQGVISVSVEANVPGTIHCYIKEKMKGIKVYNLKEKLDGNPFIYQTEVKLKPGDYAIYWTENCKLKITKSNSRADQSSAKEILMKYRAKMEQLKAKGSKLTEEEKEKLLKLEQLSQQLETDMKKKEAHKKRIKLSKKAAKEVKSREEEIKKLYVKCSAIKSKGESMTEKDKQILKKCETMIKKHRKEIQKIMVNEGAE